MPHYAVAYFFFSASNFQHVIYDENNGLVACGSSIGHKTFRLKRNLLYAAGLDLPNSRVTRSVHSLSHIRPRLFENLKVKVLL